MDLQYNLAGIDVHKRMLAVVVKNARDTELQFECWRFGTTMSELRHLSAWLQERAVQGVVMDQQCSTGGQCGLHWRVTVAYISRKRDRIVVHVAARLISGRRSGQRAVCFPEI
jgi:hypothetical protein